jgi:two-component system cell cycle sensor histidine kinase/response regulator CckA
VSRWNWSWCWTRRSTPRSTPARELADPAQLRQILLNLVLNARDAMPQGGRIRLSTRAAEFFPVRNLTENFPARLCQLPVKPSPGSARRAVSLAVQDNGCGMDAATRARLFEPFFTTKKPGEGTGLGLATVHRIVSETGGRIEVESEPGRGTLIEVFLPVVESAAPTPSLKESSLEESSLAKSSDEAPSNRASPPEPSP